MSSLTRPALVFLFVAVFTVVSSVCYAPDDRYDSSDRVLQVLNQISLAENAPVATKERVALIAIERLDPSAPPDDRIAARVLRILNLGLPRTKEDSAPLNDADAAIYARQHSNRSKLVEFVAMRAQGKRDLLEGLAAIVDRDPDTRSRIEAADALAHGDWRPRSKSDPSFIVQALAKAAESDPNPLVRKQAGEGLARIHSPGGIHESDPAIAQTVLPPDPQSTDFTLSNRVQTLLLLGVEKPHVSKVLEENIDSVVKFLRPEMQSLPFYPAGRARVDLLFNQLRLGAKEAAKRSPVTVVGIYDHWDPILTKLATHFDPQIQMDAVATQLRLATDALTAVVDNDRPFDQYPKIKPQTLSGQMSRHLKKLGKLVEQSTGDAQLAGVRLMGEFVSEHPDAAAELIRIGKLPPNRKNANLQLAISAELVRHVEMRGNDLPQLIDAITQKAPGHENFRGAILEGARNSPFVRNMLLDIHKQSSKKPAIQNLIAGILTDPTLIASLGSHDDRTINFYVKQTSDEAEGAPSREALSRVSTEGLSKASQRKVIPFQPICLTGNAKILDAIPPR